MMNEIGRSIRPAVVLLVAMAAITGVAYPALITTVAQATMPAQANGSLVMDGDRVIGSALIAQDFAGAEYLHPRASAAGKGFEANNSGATNFAPGSKDLKDAVEARLATARSEGIEGPVPPDLVTASASGLDPDLSPASALAQALRVAAARGVPAATVTALIERETKRPLLGIIGEPTVNVLLVNRQLDGIAPKPKT